MRKVLVENLQGKTMSPRMPTFGPPMGGAWDGILVMSGESESFMSLVCG